MLKSILAACGSLASLILRVMLVVASVIAMLFLGVSAFTEPFRWGGAGRLLGALAAAVVFVLLVRVKPEKRQGTERK